METAVAIKENNLDINTKKVFVSYSWDSEKHKDWVAGLVSKLRQEYGVDAIFDENSNQNNLNRMMVNEIMSCDKIILIITENYTEKANNWAGGVGIEVQLYFDQIFQDNVKIIPIIKEKCDLPKVLSGLRYIDFSSSTMIGYPKFDELARRIFDIQSYNIPNEVKQTRKVKPQKVPNPIFDYEKPESLDIHIVKFLDIIEKSKEDNVSAYDLLSSIINKKIDDKYLPSIYRLYEHRQNNNTVFLEEQMLWGELFVNIWCNNYKLNTISIQNIIGLLKTQDYFIVNAIVERALSEDGGVDEFYVSDVFLSNQLSETLVKCLEIKNHLLAKNILILMRTIGVNSQFNVLNLLDNLDDNIKMAYFQEFIYYYRPSYFFNEGDIDSLLNFININNSIKDYVFDIISNLRYVKSIEVLYENKIYDKEGLINAIIYFGYSSTQNNDYLVAYRNRLDSYPNKEYVQSGADKVKADILEYLIMESNVDKFIDNFPVNYHGLDEDYRIITGYLSKIQFTEEQSKKIEKIIEILENSQD